MGNSPTDGIDPLGLQLSNVNPNEPAVVSYSIIGDELNMTIAVDPAMPQYQAQAATGNIPANSPYYDANQTAYYLGGTLGPAPNSAHLMQTVAYAPPRVERPPPIDDPDLGHQDTWYIWNRRQGFIRPSTPSPGRGVGPTIIRGGDPHGGGESYGGFGGSMPFLPGRPRGGRPPRFKGPFWRPRR